MLYLKGYLNCFFISSDTFLPYIYEYFNNLEIKKIKIPKTI